MYVTQFGVLYSMLQSVRKLFSHLEYIMHAQYSFHISSQWNVSFSCSKDLSSSLVLTMETRGSPCKKRRKLSLSLSKGKRFSVTSKEEFHKSGKAHVPKNTAVAVNWELRLFTEWITHSNEEASRSYAVSNLWSCDNAENVCKMLSLFWSEVRQRNGEPYTPKSLLKVLINLQKYAHNQCPSSILHLRGNSKREFQQHQ